MPAPTPATPAVAGVRRRWWQRDFYAGLWPSLLSGLLLWLAFPPLNWTPLAWLAPVGWLYLILRSKPVGRAGYWGLWVGASLHWLAVLEGVRRPYWALHFGWIAMSLYLAVYVLLFVASSRALVHRWRWPLWLAAPLSWIGWELARGHVITGFSAALLGHTQVRWTQLIQIADLSGAYAVSFVVMTVAACIAIILEQRRWKTFFQGLAICSVIMGATLAYGSYRWQSPALTAQPTLRVALLQGTYNTVFERNPERTRNMFRQYLDLAHRVALEHPDLDLIVWPESTFTEFLPLVVYDDATTLSPSSRFDKQQLKKLEADFRRKCRTISKIVQQPTNDGLERNIQQLVGVEVIDFRNAAESNHNSCLFLDARGEVLGRYDKNHLVMFGEYIPVMNWFPALYKYTPMSDGTAPGDGPRAFEVQGLRLSPTICFETVVPHLVRRHVVQLNRQGTPADVLVNITHDGWFWGSAILDLQQSCSIFRAVENRRPLVVAANPGLTTWVDGNGRVQAELPRETEDYLVAELRPDGRRSPYHTMGDWPSAVCLGLSILALLFNWRTRRSGAAAA